MGALVYGGLRFGFDDRLLAHLQVVISTKLRRSEPFFLNWVSSEGHRKAVWIDNGITLYCEFDGSKVPTLEREWLSELSLAANAASGLTITAENRLEPTSYALAAD